MWVAFGTGKHFRYIAAHAIASSLVADKSRAFSAFHALTVCDTVSFFGWKGKLKARNIWTAFPTVMLAFFELGTETANLSQEAFEKIEQFVVFMHEKKSTVTTVNAARQKLFSQGCKAINTYISPQSTKVAISIRLGMDQRQRTAMEATIDNTLLRADPLWLQTRP